MIIVPQIKKRGGQECIFHSQKECKNQVAAERLGENCNGQGIKRGFAGFLFG